MIIILKASATSKDITLITQKVTDMGYTPHVIEGVNRTVIGAVGEREKSPLKSLSAYEGVEKRSAGIQALQTGIPRYKTRRHRHYPT